MKNTNLCGFLICNIALLLNSGCTEDSLPTVPHTNTVPPTTEPQTPIPTVSAGEDLQVILPADFCWLSGNYSYVEARDIDKILWKKISGPPSYISENKDSLKTKLSNLEKEFMPFK